VALATAPAAWELQPGVRLPIRSVLDFRSVALRAPHDPPGGHDLTVGNVAGVGEGRNTRRTGGWVAALPPTVPVAMAVMSRWR
jgi:hypothetical protein